MSQLGEGTDLNSYQEKGDTHWGKEYPQAVPKLRLSEI